MGNSESILEGTPLLTSRSWVIWRTLQLTVWLVGLGIFLALVFAPTIGIHAFWNVLIPVAPALFAIATGFWRNVCPLGSTALLTRHMGWFTRRELSVTWQARLELMGVALLLLIVPLRHVILDLNGPATAITLATIILLAVIVCTRFEWKSAWCSGLCPIYPVEKLYGSEPVASFTNAHCHRCVACVTPCPDSQPSVSPLVQDQIRLRRLGGTLMVGGFVGYIWGWFHVQDYVANEGYKHLIEAYAWPLSAMMVTLTAYLLIERLIPDRHHMRLNRVFAAAAISCYYWYRLPALFGFALFPGDGVLVDCRDVLSSWFPVALRIFTTIFFFWWLVIRASASRTWLTRPPAAATGTMVCTQ